VDVGLEEFKSRHRGLREGTYDDQERGGLARFPQPLALQVTRRRGGPRAGASGSGACRRFVLA
jgi:hypothetical protein